MAVNFRTAAQGGNGQPLFGPNGKPMLCGPSHNCCGGGASTCPELEALFVSQGYNGSPGEPTPTVTVGSESCSNAPSGLVSSFNIPRVGGSSIGFWELPLGLECGFTEVNSIQVVTDCNFANLRIGVNFFGYSGISGSNELRIAFPIEPSDLFGVNLYMGDAGIFPENSIYDIEVRF